MSKKIYLDSLILREDFDANEEPHNSYANAPSLKITDLEEEAFFHGSIRKPDFQRETNEWSSEKIIGLIKSFLDEDLIPSVILWKSKANYLFVIDGAHRLSALIAWANDDYGDGPISKSRYDGIIPDEQKNSAEKLRQRINLEIGSYRDHKNAIKKPEAYSEEISRRARSLGSLSIQIQWVMGDSRNAESSFFKINQTATPISTTELQLLSHRRKPQGIAARAIIRNGSGSEYWSSFSSENKKLVQELAVEINHILFEPNVRQPIKTLDLPIAGKRSAPQTQLLILEFVAAVNNYPSDDISDELNGDTTVRFLKNCLKAARLMNSNDPGSIGLHPAIYFYSNDGRHKPGSFSIFLEFFLELRKTNHLNKFTRVRADFEDILINQDHLLTQIIRKYRSVQKAKPSAIRFFREIINNLNEGLTKEESIRRAIDVLNLTYLLTTPKELFPSDYGKDFDKQMKSKIYIKAALENLIKCNICRAALNMKSISVDHITRKQDGGLASEENGALAHPYCNTGFKN